MAYVGESSDREVGALGLIVSEAGSASHVAWDSGDIVLERNFDLVVQAESDDLPQHYRGGLTSFSSRAVYDHRGGLGVIQKLNEEGHISAMSFLAEEAVQRFVGQVQDDPSMREVLAQLDADEGGEIVHLVANVLLTETMKG